MSDQNEKWRNVYRVLVELAGASPRDESQFVYVMANEKTAEWRFQGKLGFGGKYWPERNKVNCYPEDLTRERQAVIDQTNQKLAELEGSCN